MTTATDTPTAFPDFGLLQIEVPEGEQNPTACLGHNPLERLDDLTADQLRQLAKDAVAAAVWLDGETGDVAECALRLTTRTHAPEVADALDRGDFKAAGDAFGQWVEGQR